MFLRIFFFSIIFFFSGIYSADASVLYFVPQEEIAGTGSGDFSIDLRLGDAQNINAVEITLKVPEEIEILDVVTGGSALSFFLDQPRYDAQTRSLTFSGIIPGGFDSRVTETSVRLATLRTRLLKAGTAVLAFDTSKTMLYLNDGNASNEIPVLENLTLPITHGKDNLASSFDDREPPEIFIPLVLYDHPQYPQKVSAIFATQDKETGLASYGVYETRYRYNPDEIDNEKFSEIESPYLLDDQHRTSYVYVRAYDKAGNHYTAVIEPTAQHTFSGIQYSVVIVALFIFGLLVLFGKYIRRYFAV